MDSRFRRATKINHRITPSDDPAPEARQPRTNKFLGGQKTSEITHAVCVGSSGGMFRMVGSSAEDRDTVGRAILFGEKPRNIPESDSPLLTKYKIWTDPRLS